MAVHVIFVCMGNIARSPMAEAVFRHMVKEAGLEDKITVDSCGTYSGHVGEPAMAGTRTVLRERGIPIEHTARKIAMSDMVMADYLIAMDRENLDGIGDMGPTKAEVRLLLEYAPETGKKQVPDPWYTGDFEEVYRLVEAGCRGLLAHIRGQKGL